MANLPRVARLYVWFVVTAGFAAMWLACDVPLSRAPDLELAVFVVLALVTSRVNVKIPFSNVHFSVDTAFVFAILILYGVLPAMVADVLGKVVLSFHHVEKGSRFKIGFNMASGALSTLGAHLAYTSLFLFGATVPEHFIAPIIGMVAAYYLVNTITVALAISISENVNLASFWVKNFLPTSLGFFAAGAIATLLMILDQSAGVLGFLVTVPIIALAMFSQRTFLQKEEEALRHIRELEDIHISTVKALALTIDAKDHYTHGHVNRVQTFAVGLARKLGIDDAGELKGISFAALVHDIGKIAVPDRVLNKPGKYTDHEFKLMQTHSVIGAEMLKKVALPFPVAHIVRHHHEKWNGRGYPDGLAGQDIPLASRILTVADVYDAIRSNRPYRPQMAKNKAIEIMHKEMGETLDPNIASVFLANLDEFEAEAKITEQRVQTDALQQFKIDLPEHVPETFAANAEKEHQLLDNLAHVFGADTNLVSALNRLSEVIGQAIAYSSFVVYLPTDDPDQLAPAVVCGKDEQFLQANLLRRGEGVSGWVYDSRKPMVGEPPPDEFNTLGRADVPFQTCLSFPLLFLGESIGVVTLYSYLANAFSAADQDMLFKLSPFMGHYFKSLVDEFRHKKAEASYK